MSITNDKPEKMKDPRRVEQGKKLAAISREAKERKRQEREDSTVVELSPEPTECNVYLRLLGLTGVGVAAYLIFKYEPTKFITKSPAVTTTESEVVKKEEKTNMIESFD